MRTASKYGINIKGEIEVDFPAVMDRVRQVRAQISDNDAAARFRDLFGINVFFGNAKFVDKDTVEVEGKQLKFLKAVVASGGRPRVPDLPGVD